MLDSQRYPRNLHIINNAKDNVIYLGFKVLNFDHFYMFFFSRNAQVTFVEKLQLEFKIHSRQVKVYIGTVVNRFC